MGITPLNEKQQINFDKKELKSYTEISSQWMQIKMV